LSTIKIPSFSPTLPDSPGQLKPYEPSIITCVNALLTVTKQKIKTIYDALYDIHREH